MKLQLQDLIKMNSVDREDALWNYMSGKVRSDDVERIALLIGQLRKNPERASRAAKKIAEVFDAMTAQDFSQWWFDDGA